MSHTTVIELQVKDWSLLERVCVQLKARYTLGDQTLTLYGSNKYNVYAKIKLPGWKYDLGINKKGDLIYDHWGSASDSIKHLHEMRKEYVLQNAEGIARRKGMRTRRIQKKDWHYVEAYA